MKYLQIVIISLVLIMAGCATSGSQSPRQAAVTSAQLFKFKPSHLMWVPSGGGIATSLAAAMVSSAGTDSPQVAALVEAIKPAKSQDVRIGVSGPNSQLTANVIIAALDNSAGQLPNLHLAFIGAREHEVVVGAAVKAKGGEFLFSEPD